ncbi:MAG TPA: glycosyltransferase family 39 protein [Bryobacteraceae bacterium]|nr:glycosyltransferase family 39 protein [Bryobacteraceae bacterium]
MRFRLHSFLALLACFLFWVAGQFFVPLLGIEADEAIFAGPLLNPRSWHYAIRVGHSHIALMIMSYIGTLKTLLYLPMFRMFGPGVWTLREPMLVAGAASIWLFYLLLRRVAGDSAALIGAVLLATDSLYLLTTCFDWGPVTLQHLLLISAVFLLVRFAQGPKAVGAERSLAGGCFLVGLAMWDKALAVWMISGMAVAAVVVCWRPIRMLATPRRVRIAALWFFFGALPLVIFNVKTHLSTFTGNVKRDPGAIGYKAAMLWNTVNGQGLFGYLTDEDWQTPSPHLPASAIGREAAGVAAASGDPRHSLMLYGLILALLVAPFSGPAGRRIVAFCLIAGAIAWVQMALTANTGGSVHHTILLWPLPTCIIAVSLAGAARHLRGAGTPVLVGVVAVLAASNLLVMNEYFVKMARNGASVSWSDAIYPLAARLRATPNDGIYTVDWGIEDGLRILGRGRFALNDTAFGMPDAGALATGHLFVGRPSGTEVFQGHAAAVAKFAAGEGFHREDIDMVGDSYGRPTFEVYRFVK